MQLTVQILANDVRAVKIKGEDRCEKFTKEIAKLTAERACLEAEVEKYQLADEATKTAFAEETAKLEAEVKKHRLAAEAA